MPGEFKDGLVYLLCLEVEEGMKSVCESQRSDGDSLFAHTHTREPNRKLHIPSLTHIRHLLVAKVDRVVLF